MARVLILTASVGEGHDRPANTLAAQLREEYPGATVIIEDALAHSGRAVTLISEDAARIVFFRWQWLWDLGFWVFAGNRVTRAVSQRLMTRLAASGILDLIAAVDPDVIVSVYPNATEVLGRLRRAGRVRVPVLAGITDLAAMHYWATRGADLHLVTHAESFEEVRRVAGDEATVVAVHGFTSPEFRTPRAQDDARRALGLSVDGVIVLVSGGGWGVGDVDGAVDEVLAVDGVDVVVCLCGRNDALAERLRARFLYEPRVRVEGFTEQMAEWMAAGDVLVHSTGGLTVLEALMRGLPAISFGWGRGHLRLNNRAYRRFGLADVADSRAELRRALERALKAGRRSTAAFDGLPSAASCVLGVLRDG